MWFLVRVVKGNKYFEPESQVGNQVIISDTTDMVVTARAMGTEGFRFEVRKGNETFVMQEFPGVPAPGVLAGKFTALAQQMGALVIPVN